MTVVSLPNIKLKNRLNVWFIGVSFVLFQFFLQLSSGVVIGALMQEMELSALQAGVLSSAFYYVYTSMQIPVGLLLDCKSTRLLLAANALLCSIGCFYFAHSHSLIHLIISRLLIGAGSAFAFVGLSHLLRQHFSLKQFAFLIGLSETLGFLVTVFGMISLGTLISHWGWRGFFNSAGLIGLAISFFCWSVIPANTQKSISITTIQNQLVGILINKKAWLNGIFVGLSFTVITVFGAMWGVPFIQIKLGGNLQQASIIDSMVFLGAAISCPLFGKLASRFKRKPLMLISCLTTAFILLLILYLPTQSPILLGSLVLALGICCGAYMLAFSIANELAPIDSLSTCTGFTNTLAMLTAPIIQPLIGFLLDASSDGQAYTLNNYQSALLIIPFNLCIASALVFFLPEKTV